MPYQRFDEDASDSDSHGKLIRIALPSDLVGLSLLDVGCNEGFFCHEAWRRGATRVVGIDRNAAFLDRARARDDRSEYRTLDFSDVLALNERFDVILLLSALHYADDPGRLLADLMSMLTPRGLFILECGVAPGSEAEFVSVERMSDVVTHPTRAMLMHAITDASVRRIGVSVDQPGDPIPRQVFHICHLRPIIVLVSGPSGSGKTTILETMSKATTTITPINLDHLLVTMSEWSQSTELVELKNSREFLPDRLYELVDEMTKAGVEELFADEVIARYTRIDDGTARPITVIEGYALSRGTFMAAFTERLRQRGCYAWQMTPAEAPLGASVGAKLASGSDA